MLFASAIGAAGYIWWITALISAVFPDKRAAAWRMILAIAFTYAVSEFALKPIFDRPRPYHTDASLSVIDARPTTPSLPSGHAAIAVAGAAAGSQLLRHSAWVWWPLAAIVAMSRVYIGVHWPSDVIAGAIVGLGTAILVLGRGQLPRTD
jgi:undecaprenyl-diphosphatase